MIDIRSDTVTKPSPAMQEAMAKAEVGDDVFGEDPTVNRLQEMVASLLGKEAALFVASGTMSNQVAINSHTRSGDEAVCEEGSHCYNFEAGASALLSGVQMHPIVGKRGVITADQIEEVIRPPNDHYPQTRLIVLENTHNRAGGTIFPIDEIARIRELADRHGLKMHLDGARLWNAAVATGISEKEYAQYFDSVSVCLSKGLGAPVGSVLSGSKEFIVEAHRYRKIYGGGMRQAGILAAAGIYAIEHNRTRLAEDHRRAKRLAEAISQLPGFRIDGETVRTNIVAVDVSGTGRTVPEVVEILKANGVLVTPFGRTRIRCVAHLDVSEANIDAVIMVFKQVFG